MTTPKLLEEMILYHAASGKWDVKEMKKQLHQSDFDQQHHQELFDTFIAIDQRGETITPDSFIQELRKRESLEYFGGEEAIRDLIVIAESIDLREDLKSLKTKSLLRRVTRYAADPDQNKAVEQIKHDIEKNAPSSDPTISFLSMEKRLKSLDDKLEKYRGKKYLGLCQKTLSEIDDKLLGLRKLILIAAAPNAGKTALTIQIGVNILEMHPEACLIYFSLEMSESDVFIRMFCNLAGMNYRTFVLGSDTHNREIDPSAYFKPDEYESIQKARSRLERMGDRLQIIDSSIVSALDSQKAITFINEVKARTNTSRVVVVIDYLQVWPIPQEQKFYNELEIDKWRIGEMKKIRDAINDDPVIVISEARKPSNADSAWGGDMSDVMGSARATYTPDCVLLLAQMTAGDVVKLIHKKDKGNAQDEIEKVKNSLNERGLAICKLSCPKGRDGMERFSIYLQFLYRKNTFKSTTEEAIRIEFERFSKEKR